MPHQQPEPHHPPERLRLADLPEDPLELFAAWYRRAVAVAHLRYPNAMCLSTASPDGRPEGRFVIVHAWGEDGFLFLTDARSAKGRALAHLPYASLAVYWGAPLELQVRVEGGVEVAPEEDADRVFAQRPRRSQATPWASRQSEVTTLEALEASLAEVDRRFAGRDPLPRPPHWRAYRLLPETMEFWAARPRRLHDRFRYRRLAGGGWERVRLAP